MRKEVHTFVESCKELSLQNSYASKERSLSDNKSTPRPERNNLLGESLMRLIRMKDHARRCARAKHVNTWVAHSNYINTKKEGEAEPLLSEARKK